jgi:predicted RNase H-like HicB family nuclease
MGEAPMPRGNAKTPMQAVQLTTVIEREGDGYVSFCPQIDVASQGSTAEEARTNLHEAVGLFLECANSTEIRERIRRSRQ